MEAELNAAEENNDDGKDGLFAKFNRWFNTFGFTESHWRCIEIYFWESI